MHSIRCFCNGILAFSTLVSASYHVLPRNYEASNSRLYDTSIPTLSLVPPNLSPSIHTNSSASSTTTSSSSSSSYSGPVEITTFPEPTCSGSILYYGSTPPTVYMTITEAFTVTVTASDVSLTTPAIYTPPPPCLQSVIVPNATPACQFDCPENASYQIETYTGSAYTSTVFVTKKTPVPTVVPDTSAPPDFHISSTSAPPVISPAPRVQQSSTVPAVQTPNPIPGGNTSKGATGGKDGQTTTANVGSPINPGINVLALSTLAPTSANVKGVPVVVLPSSSAVVIGGQVVSIPPSASETTVVANGNTFTLGKSSIIGPGTTIALAADTAPAPVTADGLTFTVGATQAIISGATYAIGAGAPTTTLTIGGQTIVVGPSGVAVPGKTIAPAKATDAAPLSVVTAGGLTIAYDNTEAIVGSSTYRIGQGAPRTVVTVDGKTVSLGAGGVGLASSTIPPAKVTGGLQAASAAAPATQQLIGSSMLFGLAAFLGCLLV